MIRVLVGGITADSALLRVDGAQPDELKLTLVPQHRGVAVTQLEPPRPPGVVLRHAFAVTGLRPSTGYTAWATPGRMGSPGRFETPPATIAPGRPLRLGLSSCYYPSDAFVRRPEAARRCWWLDGYPHAVFHCGDQVYADVPQMQGAAVPHYRTRYERAWSDERLGELLRINGHFFTPDDHEYWNDYPRRSFYLGQSSDKQWGATARVAAEAFWANQGYWNFAPGMTGGSPQQRGWAAGSLSGVPVFVADTRTDRSLPNGKRAAARHLNGSVTPPATAHFMADAQLQALRAWLADLDSLGILVIGQPLATRTSKVASYVTDYALNAYTHQFGKLMEAIKATLARGITLVVLSGDIHWGRLVEWTAAGGGRLVEYVASPIARIGGLKSLYSTKDHGGPHRAIKQDDWKDLKAVSDHLPGYGSKVRFATGDNNVGSLTIEATAPGRRSVRFRSYSLETIALARDEGPAGGSVCDFTLGV